MNKEKVIKIAKWGLLVLIIGVVSIFSEIPLIKHVRGLGLIPISAPFIVWILFFKKKLVAFLLWLLLIGLVIGLACWNYAPSSEFGSINRVENVVVCFSGGKLKNCVECTSSKDNCEKAVFVKENDLFIRKKNVIEKYKAFKPHKEIKNIENVKK